MNGKPRFSFKEVLEATGARRISGEASAGEIQGISIDSRTIQPGELFIAIRGQRFDGHEFLREALQKGASGAIIEEEWCQAPKRLNFYKEIRKKCLAPVPDTLKAFGDLANFHRRRLHLPLVAITGSCGKSTTKEMLHQILGPEETLATEGTQNNLVGVPLTLLRLNSGHRAAVLELGTNRWGEIRRLTEIAEPTIGIITNIGAAHLETFGDLRGVLRAKEELWEAMEERGLLVLNADDPLLWEAGRRVAQRVIWFGENPKADLRAAQVRLEGWSSCCRLNDSIEMRIPIPGRHNLMNALAAVACAQALGVELSHAVRRLQRISPLAGRLAPIQWDGSLLIDDSYNANPTSLKAALEVLGGIDRPGRRIVLIGDMLELGEQAEVLHAQAGRWIAQAKVDFLIAVGPLAKRLMISAQEAGLAIEATKGFDSSEEAGRFLTEILKPGDAVLLKGSRGMKMERAIPDQRCSTTSSLR